MGRGKYNFIESRVNTEVGSSLCPLHYAHWPPSKPSSKTAIQPSVVVRTDSEQLQAQIVAKHD